MSFKMPGLKVPSLKVPRFLKSVRYTLAGINVLFLLTGILLLISGAVIMIQNLEYELLITNKFLTLPAFVIATGTIIIFASLLGSYAAISESFYFIAGYVVLMAMILIFEISIAIMSSTLRNGAVTEIRQTMTSTIQEYSTKREVAKAWDELQSEFECCGIAGVYDWSSARIPVSCCHIDIGTVSPFECTISDAYNRGCASELGAWLAYNAHVLAAIALTVTCVQVLLTAISCWLAWRSKFEEVELES